MHLGGYDAYASPAAIEQGQAPKMIDDEMAMTELLNSAAAKAAQSNFSSSSSPMKQYLEEPS